jgi:hypothetical protein
MTPSRVHDPEVAKTVVISFKTAVEALTTINQHTFKIVYFSDTFSGRLIMDTTATYIGKQDPSKHARRIIFIYKAHVYQSRVILRPKKMPG